jgi:hypothetical protein
MKVWYNSFVMKVILFSVYIRLYSLVVLLSEAPYVSAVAYFLA